MPKPRRNINVEPLNQEERDEFRALGYSEDETDAFATLLQQPNWDFWSRETNLYLSLAAYDEVTFKSGKAVSTTKTTNVMFQDHTLPVTDRRVAKLIFQSDGYREGRIKLYTDKVKEDAEKTYEQFKTAVLKDPKMVERLQKELQLQR